MSKTGSQAKKEQIQLEKEHARQLFKDGQTATQVAAVLGKKPEQMSNWAREFEKEGIDFDPDGGHQTLAEWMRSLPGGEAVKFEVVIDPEMDKLYITHVHTVLPDADVFFPEIDPAVWERESTSETHTDPETGFTFEFVVYKKR